MRNPFFDRSGPPLRLGTRAARWGAAALVLAAIIVSIPVIQGYREGPRAPVLAPTPWEALVQMGREMAMGG